MDAQRYEVDMINKMGKRTFQSPAQVAHRKKIKATVQIPHGAKPGTEEAKPFEPEWAKDASLLPKRPPRRAS